MNDEIIIVTAAGAGTWMRERLTPSGITRMLGESIISDYQDKMEILRSIDDQIYNWSKDLGTYVDLMEQAYKSRRIMEFIGIVVKIDELLKNISSMEEQVFEISEKAWREFEQKRSFEGTDYELADESLRERLTSLFPEKKSEEIYGLEKQAGFFSDLTRKWVYEKLRSQKQQQRDAALMDFVKFTKKTVEEVQTLIKQLHKYRASGDIGKYLDVLKFEKKDKTFTEDKISIQKLQKVFEKKFKDIYNKHLKELVLQYSKEDESEKDEPSSQAPSIDRIAPAKPVESTAPQPAASAVPVNPPLVAEPGITSSESTALSSQPIVVTEPIIEQHQLPPVPELKVPFKLNKDTIQKEIDQLKEHVDKMKKVNPSDLTYIAEKEKSIKELEEVLKSTASHINFITKLASCSNQYEAAHELLKYSQKIEDQDLESSLKLLAIAEGLLDD